MAYRFSTIAAIPRSPDTPDISYESCDMIKALIKAYSQQRRKPSYAPNAPEHTGPLCIGAKTEVPHSIEFLYCTVLLEGHGCSLLPRDNVYISIIGLTDCCSTDRSELSRLQFTTESVARIHKHPCKTSTTQTKLIPRYTMRTSNALLHVRESSEGQGCDWSTLHSRS
jgi:hypothetical protein